MSIISPEGVRHSWNERIAAAPDLRSLAEVLDDSARDPNHIDVLNAAKAKAVELLFEEVGKIEKINKE